jgi:hypothetical protein
MGTALSVRSVARRARQRMETLPTNVRRAILGMAWQQTGRASHVIRRVRHVRLRGTKLPVRRVRRILRSR